MSARLREVLRTIVRETSPMGPTVQFDDDTPLLARGIVDSLGMVAICTGTFRRTRRPASQRSVAA